MYQQEEMMKEMLAHNPQIDRKDDKGMTPLMYAARTPNSKIFALLLQKGADINSIDKKGRTALVHATHDINIQYEYKPPSKWEYTEWEIEPIFKYPNCDKQKILKLIELGSPLQYCVQEYHECQMELSSRMACANETMSLKTTVLFPAVRAGCHSCMELLASTRTLNYNYGGIVLKLLGQACNHHSHEILRNACMKYKNLTNLQSQCKMVIRKCLQETSRFGLYTTVKGLPLPKRLRWYILDTSDVKDPWQAIIYKKNQF